jgi:hypothetical protein
MFSFRFTAHGPLHRGEPDLAILATKEAGLDLKLFAVDASFDPQGQFNKIAKIEEKYELHKSGASSFVSDL